MIYRATYVMVLMRAAPLLWQVGGGWALEIEILLGPVKWHRAVRQAPFGTPKGWDFQGPPPPNFAQVLDLPASKNHYIQGCTNQRSMGSFMYMSFQVPLWMEWFCPLVVMHHLLSLTRLWAHAVQVQGDAGSKAPLKVLTNEKRGG